MSPAELVQHFERLGVTPPIVARISGRHKRTVYRYRSGESPVPEEFARWLRSVVEVDRRDEVDELRVVLRGS